MHDSADKRTSGLGDLAKQLPSFLVLIVVLVLLRGPRGTWDALVLQATVLLGSFLGTGDGLGAVVLHTLPLAASAAIATLLVSRGVLTFESFGSVVGVSVIIGAGALIGGILREFVPRASVPESRSLAMESVPPIDAQPTAEKQTTTAERMRNAKTSDRPATITAGYRKDGSVRILDVGRANMSSGEVAPTSIPSQLRLESTVVEHEILTQPTAWQQLQEIQWLAEPRMDTVPKGKIRRLHVFPEPSSVIGLVGWAVNQLLGYFVAYQPRLFLAAVIAGGWMGWSMHHHLGKSS